MSEHKQRLQEMLDERKVLETRIKELNESIFKFRTSHCGDCCNPLRFGEQLFCKDCLRGFCQFEERNPGGLSSACGRLAEKKSKYCTQHQLV